MLEPEAVRLSFGCGPGMCDMDTSTSAGDGTKLYVGGAEGLIKAGLALWCHDTVMFDPHLVHVNFATGPPLIYYSLSSRPNEQRAIFLRPQPSGWI